MLFSFKILLKTLCFYAAHISLDKRLDSWRSETSSLSCWPKLHFFGIFPSVSSHLLFLVMFLDFKLFRGKGCLLINADAAQLHCAQCRWLIEHRVCNCKTNKFIINTSYIFNKGKSILGLHFYVLYQIKW